MATKEIEHLKYLALLLETLIVNEENNDPETYELPSIAQLAEALNRSPEYITKCLHNLRDNYKAIDYKQKHSPTTGEFTDNGWHTTAKAKQILAQLLEWQNYNPCPFCGQQYANCSTHYSSPSSEINAYITCYNCTASGPVATLKFSQFTRDSAQERIKILAKEKWNQRKVAKCP